MKSLNLTRKQAPKIKKSKGVLVASDLRYLKNHASEFTIDQWAIKFSRSIESIRALLNAHHLEAAKELKIFGLIAPEEETTELLLEAIG